MIFQQLSDPEYSVYLDYTDDGIICNKADTPENILKEFEGMNEEHRKIFDKDLITIE